MRDDTKTGFEGPHGAEFGFSLIQVPLGQARSRPALVDEEAVTLRVPAVPPRGLFPHVPREVSGIIGGALLMACLTFAIAPAPSMTPAEPIAEQATEIETEGLHEPPASDRGPVLASAAVSPQIEPFDAEDEILIFEEDDVADDEIIIFEEPPKRATLALKSKPKRSRSAARALARQGRKARSAGNDREAKKHYRAALDAWPKHAAAASALAELYLEDRRYRQALPYAKRAANNAPTNAEYHLLHGDALFLAKQRAAARRAWKKAAALGNKVARRRLG